MTRLRSYLTLALLLSAILALLSLTALLLRAQWTLEEMRLLVVDGRYSAKQIGQAAATWNNYSSTLAKQLQTEKNQKAIDAGIALAASAQGSIRLLNSQVVPRVMRSLDAVELSTLSLNAMVRNTDASLNTSLLPEAAKLLSSLRATSDAFGVDGRAILAEVAKLATQGQTSLDAVNKVLTSPEWLAILENVKESTANIEATTAQLPATAASVEKILKTSAQWQKPIMLAGLLATLARAFIP